MIRAWHNFRWRVHALGPSSLVWARQAWPTQLSGATAPDDVQQLMLSRSVPQADRAVSLQDILQSIAAEVEDGPRELFYPVQG